jgi:hypothetical protein
MKIVWSYTRYVTRICDPLITGQVLAHARCESGAGRLTSGKSAMRCCFCWATDFSRRFLFAGFFFWVNDFFFLVIVSKFQTFQDIFTSLSKFPTLSDVRKWHLKIPDNSRQFQTACEPWYKTSFYYYYHYDLCKCLGHTTQNPLFLHLSDQFTIINLN